MFIAKFKCDQKINAIKTMRSVLQAHGLDHGLKVTKDTFEGGLLFEDSQAASALRLLLDIVVSHKRDQRNANPLTYVIECYESQRPVAFGTLAYPPPQWSRGSTVWESPWNDNRTNLEKAWDASDKDRSRDTNG